MNFWESSGQQENMLIRKSMVNVNLNIFEINELYVSTGITCDEPFKVSTELKEEEGEYPCILDIDQSQEFVLGLKDEMTWSHGDKQNRTLVYLDSGLDNRLGKKFIMT